MPEPVILRFNGKEYKVFLIVKNDNPFTSIDGPFTPVNNIGTDTEVEAALPLINHWNNNYSTLLDNLEKYYKIFKLFKRNTDFSFTKGVI